MDVRALLALVVLATGIFLILIIYLTLRFYHLLKQPQQPPTSISKLHQQEPIFNNKRQTNYHVLRQGVSSKQLFSWSDNPSLVTDAVENGWSRFAFNNFVSLPSTQWNNNKSIVGYCGGTRDREDVERVEIGWEVCRGSDDFMQKIRFNSGLTKAVSVIKAALPLPGPGLGTSSPFPQDAYFEITILSLYADETETEMSGKMRVNKGEGEKIELIKGSPSSNGNSNSNSNINSNGMSTRVVLAKVEELKGRSGGKDKVEGKTEMVVVLSVGLARGGSLPLKLPGCYPGSIGFNSDGTIHLEGVKLIDPESDQWGTDTVIGCGYNPSEKKVYFTINAKLVCEVHCTTEEFETPLYPILASNTDVTILVNFGQSVFKYTQANINRTPNPCFIRQLVSSPILQFEDSKELFSMRRIDVHWSDPSVKRNSHFGSVNRGMSDYDESSEGDLFEIVLDNNSHGRSSGTPF